MKTALILTVVALMLAACSSSPTLLPKGRIAPDDVDFTGTWSLRPDDEPSSGRWPGAGSNSNRPITDNRQQGRRTTRRSSGSSVHLFLETGRLLKISQTEHGFFVSIDRSIVEELVFGENRIVSVGPVEAQRVSGWEGSRYVVETLDDKRAILREIWQLDESGDVLIRDISIVERDKQKFALRQRFDRQ